MTEDILNKMNDEVDDDSLENIPGDSSKDSSDGIGDVKKESSIKKIFKKIFRSKKAIIIMAISFVLLTSLVIGVWFFFFKASPEKGEDVQNTIAARKDVKGKPAREDEVVFEDIVNLEPFEHIHLKKNSTMALISMNLSLELTDSRFRKQVYTMEDRIRKIVTGQLEEMTWLELRNPEGKIMLKYDLLKRINSIFPKTMVRNIYFTYFIMQ